MLKRRIALLSLRAPDPTTVLVGFAASLVPMHQAM